MGDRPVRRKRITVRSVLAYLLTAAAAAGLGYLIYVFCRVPFFRPWLRWTLVGSAAVLIVFCAVTLPKLGRDR